MFDAVLVAIQHDNFYIAIVVRVVFDVIDKLLVILDASIDEDYFPGALLGLGGGLVISLIERFVCVEVAEDGTG